MAGKQIPIWLFSYSGIFGRSIFEPHRKSKLEIPVVIASHINFRAMNHRRNLNWGEFAKES